MRTVVRGLQGAIRSPLRSGLVVALLAVSVGLTLVMLTVNGAFGKQIDDLKADFGTDITVRPAGSLSFPGGGFALRVGPGAEDAPPQPTISDEDLAKIAEVPGVRAIKQTAQASYDGDELESSVEFGGFSVAGGEEQEEGDAPAFTIPITVMGTNTPEQLDIFGGGVAAISEGETFSADDLNANVAVVGQKLAEKNELAVGDTFTLNGEEITVVGISSSGQSFGDDNLFMPLETVKRLFELEGVTEATVLVENVDRVESVADDIRAALGDDVVDVVTAENEVEAIAGSLTRADDNSRTGLIAALAVSALVIIFSVVLAARQRIKEMGILKAIGASNLNVVGQFGVETLALSLVAALLGALLTYPAAERVADTLISEPTAPGGAFTPGGDVVAGAPLAAAPIGDDAPTTFGNLGGAFGDVDVAVSPEVFLWAIALAVGLALVASLVVSWYVTRVKPVEVLRYE